MSMKKNGKQIPCWNWEACVINDKLDDAVLGSLIISLLAVKSLIYSVYPILSDNTNAYTA